MPAWTDCAARRSHPARHHRFSGSMRLRVPIRHDERIGNIPTDKTLPPVILPGTVPLEMRGDTQSPAPFTGHGVLHWAFGTRTRSARLPMIVFIGTLFPLLHIVRLFTIIIIARGPDRDDPGEQRQDDQGNDRVHRMSCGHRATGGAAARDATLCASRRERSPAMRHENRSRSIAYRCTDLCRRRGQLT